MDEDKILRVLRWLNRTFGAVCSFVIAAYLECCDRTCRYWLRKLEAAGRVWRRGERSGWMVV